MSELLVRSYPSDAFPFNISTTQSMGWGLWRGLFVEWRIRPRQITKIFLNDSFIVASFGSATVGTNQAGAKWSAWHPPRDLKFFAHG